MLLGATDTTLAYGQRKSQLDALIGAARVAGVAWRDWIVGWMRDSAAGLPLRAPTRWAIVTRLVATASPTAGAATAAPRPRVIRRAKDSARRSSPRAACPTRRQQARLLRALVRRQHAERGVGDVEPARVSRSRSCVDDAGLLVPSLDTLPWIQQNRRIFFLGAVAERRHRRPVVTRGAAADRPVAVRTPRARGRPAPQGAAGPGRTRAHRTHPADLRRIVASQHDILTREGQPLPASESHAATVTIATPAAATAVTTANAPAVTPTTTTATATRTATATATATANTENSEREQRRVRREHSLAVLAAAVLFVLCVGSCSGRGSGWCCGCRCWCWC